MQEAGACLQTFLDIMGGRVSPTTLFVLAIEIRAIADPCQRVAMAQNDWLRDQLSKLKSKVARREPRKTYMLSDIDSSYLVGCLHPTSNRSGCESLSAVANDPREWNSPFVEPLNAAINSHRKGNPFSIYFFLSGRIEAIKPSQSSRLRSGQGGIRISK
ncbi:hypothetical protein LWI28_027114 [Acer negundo]|uniref:Uncharacterized protein n=1 Tax=Acer negundo TaxID=4023 RepID=A0AAD5NP43_ACENE|nr:hypothetical protein LWI28_027114 [Acer negundo]